MALATLGRILWPDPNRLAAFIGLSANTLHQLSGAGQRYGWAFCVPRTGTITKVGWRVHTCASVQLSRLGLYTLDSSGQPTSTGYGGSAYGTFTPAATSYFETTLATPATATRGDFAAIVVEFDGTPGDMFASVENSTCVLPGTGYACKYNGTTWSKIQQRAISHVYYSDSGGQWEDIGTAPFTGSVATGTYNLNTGGADEYALKITPPFACRAAGLWTMFGVAAGADYEALLYSGTTALATAAIDGDFTAGTAGLGLRFNFFPTPVTLTAGATCRLAIRPTTATSITYRNYTLEAAGSEQGLGVPQGTCQSTRLDQGAWSDQTTTFPCLGLILDQLDDGRRYRGRRGN